MSFAGMRPAAKQPKVTAGLKCPPETCPTAKAIVRTERPKANETPRRPIPTWGKAAASTALPHPPKTSHSVPRNSAESFCVRLKSFMVHPPRPGTIHFENSSNAGSADVLVRTASEAPAAGSRFALIADGDARAPSSESLVKLNRPAIHLVALSFRSPVRETYRCPEE